MAYITKKISYYQCDYCGIKWDEADHYRFVVNKDSHACYECGYGLMGLLDGLDIKYEAIRAHHDPDHYEQMGSIDFDPNKAIPIGQVALVAVRSMRHRG